MLSVIAVLCVLFFCLNVLFDVHLFVLFLPAEVRRFLFCGLDVLSFWYKWSFWCAPFRFVFACRVAETFGFAFLAVLACCLFCINDLFDVHLFVLFCEPKCEVFWFCVFGGQDCQLRLAGARLRQKKPRSTIVWFWQTRFSRGGHFEPTAKVCVKFAWLVLRFRLPQAYANAIRRVRRICLTE